MQILFISEYYPPLVRGGGEINLQLLATALAKQGCNVAVLTASSRRLASYEEQAGVKIYRRLKTGNHPGSFKSNIFRRLLFPRSVDQEARKLVSEINPDLIHFIGTSIIAAPQLKELNKPLFATIESYPTLCPKGDRLYHGQEECKIVCNFKAFASCQRDSEEIGKMKNRWYLKYNPLFLRYVYNYYKKLNQALSYCTLISISSYVQQLLLLHNHRSTVIPDILEVEKFLRVQNLTPPKTKLNKVRLLYLGSLIKSKGPQVLLEALKGLDSRCDLYGEGNLKGELQNLITKYKLDAEIHPPVPYETVPELYAQADLVVFPSIWPEPFGRIVIEAMAAGKMVIGAQVGGIPETMGDDKERLFSAGDPKALRQILQLVIKNNKRPVIDLNLYDQYQPENIITKLIRVYQP